MTKDTDSPNKNDWSDHWSVHWSITEEHQTPSMLQLIRDLTGKEAFKSRHPIEITGSLAQWGQFILVRHLRGQDKNWIQFLEPRLLMDGENAQLSNVHIITDQPLRELF